MNQEKGTSGGLEVKPLTQEKQIGGEKIKIHKFNNVWPALYIIYVKSDVAFNLRKVKGRGLLEEIYMSEYKNRYAIFDRKTRIWISFEKDSDVNDIVKYVSENKEIQEKLTKYLPELSLFSCKEEDLGMETREICEKIEMYISKLREECVRK